MTTPDPAWGFLNRLLGIAERLNVPALLAALPAAILTKAALDRWHGSSSVAAWIDETVFPGATFAALLALWTLAWNVVIDARAARRAAAAEEARHTAVLEAARRHSEERIARRRETYGACSAAEKAVLAVFVRRSVTTLDRQRLIAEAAGVEFAARRQVTHEEQTAISAAAAAVHSLRAREFLEPMTVPRETETVRAKIFRELVADPSLIGLDLPRRPVAPSD